MAENVERVHEPATTETTRTTTDQVDTRPVEQRPASIAARVVWFIAGVILTLLAFRFVLILLGANEGSGFVDFIYSASYPFAAPFFGIFGYDLEYGVSRIEISTLVAMAVYAIFAAGLARLLTIKYPRH